MFFENNSLEDRIIKAKNDTLEINKLISQFKPFIASVIQKKLGRYLEYGIDDELSIGLMAFNEAINSYDKNKGKFLSFARLVINNRLTDYYRKSSKHQTVSLNTEGNSDNENNNSVTDILNKKSVESYALDLESETRKLELIEYSKILKDWGIRFRDLVKVSPKHENLRKEYIRVAKIIAEDKSLLEILLRTRRLPIKELGKKTSIHRKKIERGRIYIISIVIAIVNKFSFLSGIFLE